MPALTGLSTSISASVLHLHVFLHLLGLFHQPGDSGLHIMWQSRLDWFEDSKRFDRLPSSKVASNRSISSPCNEWTFRVTPRRRA